MKVIPTTVGVLGLGALAAPVLANEPVPAPAVTAQAPARGARVHDGFYLRLGTGFGAYSEAIRKSGEDRETLVNGVSTVGEFALGGALRPGFILGGGVWSSTTLASDRTVRGPTPSSEIGDRRGEFSMVGPFIDYYPDARRGLHFQGAIGLANLRGLDAVADADDRVAVGGGLMLGAGYEWFVSSEWSIGILGRLALGIASDEDKTDTRWYHTVGATPSVLFSATYN